MKHFKTLALAFCAAALLVGCSTKDAKEDVMKNTKSFIDDVKDKVNVTGVEYYTGESLFYNASDNDPQVLVGNGKAYAYINMPGYYKPGEQGHTAIADLAVEIDLYNKTMKKVQGLDLSNGFGVMLSLYKGSMLIGNSSAKAKGIYSLDIQTGEVSKEPILTTVGNPILCYYFEK